MFKHPARMVARMPVAGRQRWPWLLMASAAPLLVGYTWTNVVSNDAKSSKPFVTLMNPAQVSARLRDAEESFLIDRNCGVLRYDVAQLASNNPIEDDRSERVVSVPLVSQDDKQYSTDWLFWGVYDGHGGWSTSYKLRESLIAYAVRELDKLYEPVAPGAVRRFEPKDPKLMDEALITAFKKLDDDIVNKSIDNLFANPSKKSALEAIPPALSGSCALLAHYDTHTQDLRIAVAGDSRAVLGVRQPSGHWHARSLSTDQTGSNEDEARRIRAEHPGENDTAIARGRVLGIYEPTRSFGDAITKWSPQTQRRLAREFFAKGIPRYLRTPPYMTAEPVVTHTKINPAQPTFLVIATDGLYELLSNDQVVGLVAEWMEQKRPTSLQPILKPPPKTGSGSGSWLPSFLSRPRSRTNDGVVVEDVSENKDSQKPPIRSGRQPAGPHTAPVQAQFLDNNAATHLMRNALGTDPEQVSMMLSIPPPMSRRYRDDLTVTVVFFGGENGDEQQTVTGKILVNQEATHAPKAKL